MQILTDFLYENCNLPWIKSPPLSQQQPSESWGPTNPSPFLKICLEVQPPSPNRKGGGGVHTIQRKLTSDVIDGMQANLYRENLLLEKLSDKLGDSAFTLKARICFEIPSLLLHSIRLLGGFLLFLSPPPPPPPRPFSSNILRSLLFLNYVFYNIELFFTDNSYQALL